MKIYDFGVVDRCLFLKKDKIVIVGDLHLGYEDGLIKSGISIPRTQLAETIAIFNRVFEKTGKVKKIILLGDVKHYFGKILAQEREDFESIMKIFLNYLDKDGQIIITAGNHDKILLPITKKYNNIRLLDKFLFKNIFFMHGDASSIKKSYLDIKNKKTKLIVLGHFHPAYILKDKGSVKEEKYKCFLYGKSKEYGKNVIFVPSFFPPIEGSDIKKELEIFNKGMKAVLVTNTGNIYKFSNI